MLHSMTGYGRGSHALNEDVTLRVELKSVNHRSLDIKSRIPQELSALEQSLASWLRKRVGRGRVEVRLEIERSSGSSAVLNTEACRAVYTQLDQLRSALGLTSPVELSHVLQAPGVWQPASQERLNSEEVAFEACLPAFEAATAQLVLSRKKEGAALAKELSRLLGEIQSGLGDARKRAPERVTRYRERLEERLSELLESSDAIAVDAGRLAQEVAIFADRVDVAEELSRADVHLEALGNILSAPQGDLERVGKRIDFFLQELGREVNTLASKSRDAELTQIAIDMKSALESMREQTANIQ